LRRSSPVGRSASRSFRTKSQGLLKCPKRLLCIPYFHLCVMLTCLLCLTAFSCVVQRRRRPKTGLAPGPPPGSCMRRSGRGVVEAAAAAAQSQCPLRQEPVHSHLRDVREG
jgi:hypothetical protein